MKKIFSIVFLLALFLGANAQGGKWAEVYSIDYSTYNGFPFYVLGYVPEFDNGHMTDYGANYKYVQKDDAEETSDVIVKTQDGKEYYKISLESPGWHQYFIADNFPTKIDGKYKVVAKVKASEAVTINVNMGWGWGEGEQARASVSIPEGADFQEIEWEYSGIGGASCYLVAQPGTCAETIEWLSLTVYEWQKGDQIPIEWFEDITNGDAEMPWTDEQKAIRFDDQEKNFTICAWSKEKGRNMNEKDGWDPFPADIELEEGTENHVFVCHGKPATTEGDPSAWDNQFWIQSKHAWKAGTTLKIKFRYKCDYAGGSVKTNTQVHKQTPSAYLFWHAIGDITFTNDWQTFDGTMAITDDMAGSWSIAFNLNSSVKDAVNFYFDDLSWQYLKLEEGYFVSGINVTKTNSYDDLDNAIQFETEGEYLVATIGEKGNKDSYVDQLMISTTRGDDQAFKGATLKPTGKIHNDPDEWLEYAASTNAKLDLPGLGVWKVWIDMNYNAMAFQMLEGQAYEEQDPVAVVTNKTEIVVKGLERDWLGSNDDGIQKEEGGVGEGQPWDNQFFIKANRALKKGEETILKFKYKSTVADAKTTTQCHGETPGSYMHWGAIGDVVFQNGDWEDFEKEFTVPNEADGMWNIAFNMAEIKVACDYSITDVQWYLKDESLDAGMTYENLINAEGTANFFVKEGAGTDAYQYNTTVNKVSDVIFFADGYTLIMKTETEGATIYYTTNGTTPTINSQEYTGPVEIRTSCTVKAFAVKEGYVSSMVTTFNFVAGKIETPMITNEGDTISIALSRTDAVIYYTIDGTDPTENSLRYTTPFAVSYNCTVKAIAILDGFLNSSIAVFYVDWFKVADVTFSSDGYMLTMATETQGASIFYTIDGSTPTTESLQYSNPIALPVTCSKVKAIGVKDKFNNSVVATYFFNATDVTTATPLIKHEGNLMTITCETNNAKIYYTLDGSAPTEQSSVYMKPFSVEENGIIKAFAVKENFFDSKISQLTVDWMKVADVTFSSDGYLLSMNTITPDATIYFTTDGTPPTIASTKYSGAVALTKQCTVTAFATKKNFKNSDITYTIFNPGNANTATPQIVNEGNVISITTATEGASIYYTMDGSEPTKASTRYVAPFSVAHNCCILAIAIKDNYIDSPIGKLEVNWFKVADVQFENNGYVLSMKCETEGATIYYTKDGSTPNTLSDKYVQPITLTAECTVRAFAAKDGFNNSDVTSYEFDPNKVTVATPIIQRIGNTNYIEMRSTTTGASIYYTTDGTIPTVEDGTLYSQAFEVTHNCTVKAIGVKENYNNSEVVDMSVDWFRVATPTFTLDGTTLSISCSDTQATIYYSIGEEAIPSLSSTRYTVPIILTDNQPVKAIAVIEGYIDSEVAVFNEKPITSLGVDMAYDGHYVKLTPKEAEAIVYYTLDGKDPTASSEVYVEPIPLSSLVTVKAAAMRPYTNMSDVSSLEVTYVYDGKQFFSKEGGLLMKALDWCGAAEVEALCITGPVDQMDLAAIRSLPNLHTLDMEQAKLEGQMLAEDALRGAKMRWFVSPANVISVGRNALADCRQLAAITWKSATIQLTAEMLGEHRNPNMLYYVLSENMVALDGVNVVSNGHATNITLHDGEEYHDFYCPESFSTDDISYTHNFKMKTKKGVRQGWETLALPFKVQTITHSKNGELVPFAARQEHDSRKPFWLAKLDNTGFISTDAIEANTPYIISMPNDSAVYADRFLLAGDITFSAKNTMVVATDLAAYKGVMNDVVFVANYALREPSTDIYAINLYEAYDTTHPEGSIFLRDYRRVRPFEAYTSSLADHAPLFMDLDDLIATTTDIAEIQTDYGWLDKKVIRVYDLNGLLIRTATSEDVLKQLPNGVYIVNGKKLVVK